MKKILAILLACSMLLAFTACNKPAEQPQTDEQNESVKVENSIEESLPIEDGGEVKEEDERTQETEADKPSAGGTETETQPAPSDDTVGNILYADFEARAKNGNESAYALAEKLIANEIIPFMGGATEVEPGLLAGFGNTEITGFKSGASFGPMMGSIAFIGYIFELENGADASAFIAKLRSNADLRWNVCVSADQMVSGYIGNKVFFVMCPKHFEA